MMYLVRCFLTLVVIYGSVLIVDLLINAINDGIYAGDIALLFLLITTAGGGILLTSETK